MKYAHFIAQHYLSSFKVSSIWEFLLNKLDLMEEVQLCKYKFCYWILLMFLTTWKEICWSLNLMYPSKYWDMGPPAFLFCLFDCCQTPRKRLNQISEKNIPLYRSMVLQYSKSKSVQTLPGEPPYTYVILWIYTY